MIGAAGKGTGRQRSQQGSIEIELDMSCLTQQSTKETIVIPGRQSECAGGAGGASLGNSGWAGAGSLRKVSDIRQRYQVGKIIGQGSFGQVRLAVHKQLNLQCAIKIINKQLLEGSKTRMANMDSELQILEGLAHPRTVRVYELLQSDTHFFIVTEALMCGDLFQYMNARQQ